MTTPTDDLAQALRKLEPLVRGPTATKLFNEALALATHESRAQPASDLPERDNSQRAERQGLFRKFAVRRTDGSDSPGGKHHGCRYFVLDVDHDAFATPALSAYASACESTHPQLAADLRSKWGAAHPASVAKDVSEVLQEAELMLNKYKRLLQWDSHEWHHAEAVRSRVARAAAPQPPAKEGE